MQLVLSAFPGCGKSEIFKRATELGLKPCFVEFDETTNMYNLAVAKTFGIPVFDSDSSKFDKAAFPGNYISHIQNVLNTFDDVVILVSSHDNVREAMREAGIEYHLVYPQLELKGEYIERYKGRGSPDAFVNMMDEKWVDFIESCENDPTPHKHALGEGEFLVDYLRSIMTVAPTPTNTDEMSPTRTELVEARFAMEDDIEVLEKVIESRSDDNVVDGMEDNGEMLTAAAEDIKKRYNKDVEPTLAGMEGFLDNLKSALTAIGEKLKGQPKKEHLAKIQRYLSDANKAIATYASSAWLNKQQFINVGKTKIQIPMAFKDVTDVDGINKIIDIYVKALDSKYQEFFKNAMARQKAALPIFNKFAKKDEADDGAAQLAKYLPIKPEPVPGFKRAEVEGMLNVTMEKGELPVLNKDNVKKVVDTMTGIIDVVNKWETQREKLTEGPSYDDFYDSEFFDAIMDTKECEELLSAVEWENATENVEEMVYFYSKAMLPVCKFLEMWILQSVK